MSDLEPEPNCEVKVFDVTTQPLGLTTKSFLKKPLGRGFFRCIWVKSNKSDMIVVRKSIKSWPVKNTSRLLGNDSA